MHQIIKQYGKPFVEELLDILLIKRGEESSDYWRTFLLKYKLIKKSTKIIRSNVYHRTNYGDVGWVVRLKNGRDQYIIGLVILDIDLPQIREELSE